MGSVGLDLERGPHLRLTVKALIVPLHTHSGVASSTCSIVRHGLRRRMS